MCNWEGFQGEGFFLLVNSKTPCTIVLVRGDPSGILHGPRHGNARQERRSVSQEWVERPEEQTVREG